ncbi:MAG TPA: hypothetical protein VNU97_05795 [Rhizomicrobium sp.]|jgi:hypothetical protein|nr:hypothetical protein [Rhizomicrobium sp.]
MAKPKKKKRLKLKEAKSIELHPDAWRRFEKDSKQIAKTNATAKRGGTQWAPE